MIYYEGTKPVVAIEKRTSAFTRRVFLEIRKGARIVWTGIRSCFGAGFWVGDKPWLNTEGWKN